jgi:hypothetical protein
MSREGSSSSQRVGSLACLDNHERQSIFIPQTSKTNNQVSGRHLIQANEVTKVILVILYALKCKQTPGIAWLYLNPS